MFTECSFSHFLYMITFSKYIRIRLELFIDIFNFQFFFSFFLQVNGYSFFWGGQKS